jgi:hypothetical protein
VGRPLSLGRQGPPPNMALQRTRRPRLFFATASENETRSGRSLLICWCFGGGLGSAERPRVWPANMALLRSRNPGPVRGRSLHQRYSPLSTRP